MELEQELEEGLEAEIGAGEKPGARVVAAVAVRCPHEERLDAVILVYEDGSMEFACPLDVANECDHECPYRVLA
ncbi:hypothetical protein DRO32_02275 [Candidatus Bathyarchaeota archaeon]|nr:MAG: hypothetical protein DRO32_02275 [Candidatus Bathyarchaeota archaeon]